MSAANDERVQRCIDEIGSSVVASYGSLSTAVGVADGLATRLSWALVKRNEEPDIARENLIGAFVAFEILRRCMMNLEADAPQYAVQGAERASVIVEMMKKNGR